MARASPTLVGGFVLGGLAIVIVGILFFGGKEAFSPKLEAVVFFEGSVGGLGPGSPVTFRGVRVGSVSRVAITVDPGAMQARIPVELKLEPDRVKLVSGSSGLPMLRYLIKAGLTARLEPESLVTGQMLVELDLTPGVKAHIIADRRSDIPEIPSVQSDLQELRWQITHAPISETVVQAKQTLASLQHVADQLSSVIGPLSDSALHVMDHASRTMDVGSAAIQEVQRSATTTLDDVQDLTKDGRQQLAARGQELSRDLIDVDKTLQSARELVTSANSIVARGSRSREDFEATLRDLSASASSLRDLLQSVDRDPSVVLRGRGVR